MIWLIAGASAVIAVAITIWIRRKNMSDYTPSGAPAFNASGSSSAIRSEFAAVQTAVNSKADKASGALTNPAISSPTITGSMTVTGAIAQTSTGGPYSGTFIAGNAGSYFLNVDSNTSTQSRIRSDSDTGPEIQGVNVPITLTAPSVVVNGVLTINGDDLVATPSELNNLSGVFTTPAQFNYLATATSNIQTQLNDKAPKADPTFTGTVSVDTIVGTAFSFTNVEITNTSSTKYITFTGIGTNIPANASATGTPGQIRVDQNYIYVCTGPNTWKRAALSTW